jgi:hypothetical protein
LPQCQCRMLARSCLASSAVQCLASRDERTSSLISR